MSPYNAAVDNTSRRDRSGAVLAPELKLRLKRLNSAAPEGVRVIATIDAANALEQFRSALELAQTPLTANAAKKICNNIKRAALRRPRRLDCTMAFSRKTIQTASAVLSQLLKSALKSMAETEESSSARRKQSPQKQRKVLIALCVQTLVALCERAAAEGSAWKYCMEYISVAADLASTSVRDLVPEVSPTFLAVKQGLISDLRSELMDGRISEASSTFASVRGSTPLRQALADSLRTMLERESSRLPISGQEWILTTLGIQHESRELSYANPADAPEIRQAAGLLLLLWDNSADNPAMHEAFERFRTLCEKHFHLYLKGQSGEITEYDSRVHEVNDGGAGRVRLTRPWIEFVDPPHSAVVLRALATLV
ncbi:MAG TPA: hypothetical protein VGS27_06680 [Candidatus Sulfotelmatobacter sp.]|nr:hypothetical protein [Candidatus Sulfotelmatobacter sp.]